MYHTERPHEALAYATPVSLYHPSSRPYPRRVPEPEYPAHVHVERCYPNGVISFRETQWYLSLALAGELVGLEEVADDRWRGCFGAIELGVLDIRTANARGYRQFGQLVRADGGITTRRGRRRRPR